MDDSSPKEDRPLSVCYFGTYNRGEAYPRNTVLMASLRKAGVLVHECHWPLFHGVEEKLRVSRSNLALLGVLIRLVHCWLRLAFQFLQTPRCNVMIVGYGGLGDMVLARLLTWFRRTPIVYDAFLSNYDVTVNDRGLCRPGSLKARLLWHYDAWMCRLADLVLLDTDAHWHYFVREFGQPPEKFTRAWIGTDKEGFLTKNKNQNQNKNKSKNLRATGSERKGVCHVVFWGTLIPVHGLETILAAADRLKGEERLDITIIGSGQLEEEIKLQAERIGSSRLHILPRMSYDDLVPAIRSADVCLGTFGASEKTERIIPCKVFESLYFAKPLVTADTPGARELLRQGQNALLVPSADPDALADALLRLATDEALREKLAHGARETYEKACSHLAIGEDLAAKLRRLIERDS